MPVKFFISYSHDEYTFKDELVKHLSIPELKDKIEIWTDEQITPGEEWNQSIRAGLLDSRIILFLVSNKFITSRYIKEIELKDTIERYNKQEVILIPIMLEPVAKEIMDLLPLKKFEPLPVVNKKEYPITQWNPQSGAYDNIINGILRTLATDRVKKDLYSDSIKKLRYFFGQSQFDSIFNELEKCGNQLREQDIDLYNTFENLRLQWKVIQKVELRRTSGSEQKRIDFNFDLLGFITALENKL